MATKQPTLSVKRADGAFSRFFPIDSVHPATEWEKTALSYLTPRAEWQQRGLLPGYCEVAGQVILGFKGNNDKFIT